MANDYVVEYSTIKETKPNVQSAARFPGYMERRHIIEEILRTEFKKKGGTIQRKSPHYMVVVKHLV